MAVELSAAVREWEARGRLHTVAGIDVFVLDTGASVEANGDAVHGEAQAASSRRAAPAPGMAPSTGSSVVILHGFPSSSFDWRPVLPALSAGRRVVLFDFPGYGLSAKPERYSYSLLEQADVVEILLRELGIDRAHVIAHDMGTSVACELMARLERGLLHFAPSSLVLMNGSVHLELAHLTPSQKLLRTSIGPLFARLSSMAIFKKQLRRILRRPVAESELDDMWAQLNHLDGRTRLPQIISYLDERMRFYDRWIGALTRLRLPALVLWGTEDPVAVFAIAEKLAEEIPEARLERLEGLGHYPQLEDPDQVGAALVRWLDGQR